jgi:hypothetical protein
MRIDDLLGLRNDVLFAAFLKVCRAVEQWTDRPPRIDRSSPAFTHRTNLQAIAFIVYNVRQLLALSAVPKNWKALITCEPALLALGQTASTRASKAAGAMVPNHHYLPVTAPGHVSPF